jgi:hypothetical protein
VVETLRQSPRLEVEVADLRELEAKLGAELEREAAPASRLKSLPTTTRLFIALGLTLLVALFEGTLVARADMELVPVERLAPMVLTFEVLAVFALWMALRPLQRVALPTWLEAALVVGALALPVVFSFVQPETGHPASMRGAGSDLLRYVATCLAHGLALAATVWLALGALDRSGLGVGFAPLGAGTAAATVAVLGLQLHCPIPNAPHHLLGHASIGAVVLGAVLIQQRLRKR